jgi:hypothetical protein
MISLPESHWGESIKHICFLDIMIIVRLRLSKLSGSPVLGHMCWHEALLVSSCDSQSQPNFFFIVPLQAWISPAQAHEDGNPLRKWS